MGRVMKVSIFGASGGTGLLLTHRCLAAGYEVTALLRSPEKFPFRDRVRVVQGTAFDPAAIRQAVDGADVVLSALGARSFKKEDVLERAIPLIVDAMRTAGVRRIIALGSAGAEGDSLSKQPFFARWFAENIIYKTFLKWPVESQKAQWRILSASGLDWTMVMPPKLTNGRPHGKLKVDGEALPRNALWISRTDVADFMMQQIVSDEWVGTGVYIAA
jgi:putative NADH-flavin reductase